jgi:23S rRNA (guanosine2251-2'-O)-methyltransferase
MNIPETEALYGAYPIIEALKAKRRKLISIYTTKPIPKAFERVKTFLPKHGNTVINYVPRESLVKICGSTEHMGIVAWFSHFQFQKKFFSPADNPRVLLLDSIQDPRNLGAILRSAHCTNFDAIILCQTKGSPLSPTATKAAAGLSEHLQIYQAASTKQAIDLCKQAGYNLYMAVLEKGEDVRIAHIKKPICLVIGNEEKGISKEIFKLGNLITLPQKNAEISYNASVAAGILMFQLSFL